MPRHTERVAASGPSAGLPRILAPRAEDLVDQVAWFNRLRLGAVLGMVVLTACAQALGMLAESRPLYLLAGVTLAVDLTYIRWFPRLSRVSHKSVRRHVDLQIAIDLIILTAILHYSGGATNPFVLFYVLHAFIAALLLSVRAALVVVAVSCGLVGALILLERAAVVAHHPLSLGLMDLPNSPPLGLVVWLAVFAATMLLSVFFVGRVLSRLGSREEQLAGVDRQLAQNEKLVSLANLAAGVAHEINNPVGVIQSKVQILRHRINDGDPRPVLLEELRTIEKHARRIGAITGGLLAFSRETPFADEPIEVHRLVREGADLVAVAFRSHGVQLQADLEGAGPRVAGSTNHLLQVLVNIMLNAKDASQPGGRVEVGAVVEGDSVAIKIRDQGEGIAPALLSKIFDPFFTTKDVDRGTGLGLAISHGIIEKHRGRIDVESEVGVGTTFTVRLPLLES